MKKYYIKKSLNQFFVLMLCIIMVIQPYNMQKAEAASGAVVYGADGTTTYTLNHSYVKQLNINTGAIAITDTSYTQTNGSSESWDAIEDAYVIKGQGTSTNNITITSTSTPITVYLVDLQWKGTIIVTGAVNLIICGTVSNTNKLLAAASNTVGFNVSMNGYSDNSILNTNTIIESLASANRSFSINNLTVNTATLNPSSSTHRDTIANFSVSNSIINVSTTFAVTLTGLEVVNEINITNSTLTNINFNGSLPQKMTIVNSKINNMQVFGKSTSITDSVINGLSIGLQNAYPVTLNNSTITNFRIAYNGSASTCKLTLSNSTILNDMGYTDVAVFGSYNFNNSAYRKTPSSTPVDNDANDVFLKKIRFRDNPNTYILTTFPSGQVSKLLTDENGYLYPFVPRGSSSLKFQITDESGTANLGNYELAFDPIQGNDTTSSIPTMSQQPTTIHTPYQDAAIEYSFDNSIWHPVTTDSSGNFQVVITEGASKVYIRKNNGETKYTVITDGTLGVWEDAKPIITAQSNSPVTLLKGSDGTLFVEAKPFVTGNTLTYQWLKDGNNIGGAIGNILTIPDADDADAGTYSCIVTESDGKINSSSPIVVTVMDSASNADELLAQISDLTNQINGLQEQLEDANTDKDTLQNTISSLQDQITDLNNQIASLQDQIENLNEELDQSGTDNEELNNLIISLNIQITELNQSKESMQNELDTAQNSNAELQDTVVELNGQIDLLTSQISVISQQLDDMEEENAELNNQITNLNKQITDLKAEIDDLKESLDALNGDNVDLIKQLEDAEVTISRLTSTLNLIKAELGVSDDADILTAIRELKNQLEDEKDKNSNLLDIVSDLEDKLADATTSNDELNHKLEELISLVGAGDSDDLINKISELQNTIISSNNQITVLEQEKIQYLSQLEAANVTISQLQAQLDALLNSGNSTEDELREQIVLLTEKVNQLQVSNKSLTDSISGLNTQITDLTVDKVKLEAEIARLESLLATANSTIEELRQQIADLTADKIILQANNNVLQEENNSLKETNTILKDENSTLKEEITNGGNSNNEVDSLKQELKNTQVELANTKKELEQAQNNHNTSPSTGSEDNGVPADSIIITPVDETVTDSIVNDEVTDPITGGTIVAKDGWVVAQNLTDEFSSSLSITESYTSLYSFYDNSSMSSSQISQKNSSDSGIKNVLSLSSGIGSNLGESITDKNGYVKYTFYARRITNPGKVFECSLDVKKSDYLTPVTSLTSSVKEIIKNYTVKNTYDVEVHGGVTLHVDADFGTYGRKEILYQLVSADKDFDSDNNWKTVKGNIITIKKVSEAERLYIKYVDNGNNYTIDKTIGFKPASEQVLIKNPEVELANPTFKMNKTIYLGYEYQVQLANIEKGSKITYTSSNNKIATVNQNGVITAISKGQATITGKVIQKDNVYQYIVEVKVSDGDGSPTLNLITPNISSTSDNPVLILYKQIKEDTKTKIEISGLSKDAVITYLTSDSKTVSVAKDGTITGIKKGSADITVLITQGGKHYIYLVKVRVDDGTKDEEMFEYLE